MYQIPKGGIPVKVPFYKTRDFLDRLENADAEPGQNLPNLPVRIGTFAGYDQRGKAVNHQPEVTELAVCFLLANMISFHK